VANLETEEFENASVPRAASSNKLKVGAVGLFGVSEIMLAYGTKAMQPSRQPRLRQGKRQARRVKLSPGAIARHNGVWNLLPAWT